MGVLHPNYIVGIGGSAGSLEAFKAFLDDLPSDTGMAFVIASHMLPTATSQLAGILSKRTKMPVMVASPAMPILPNCVYVNPPDVDLLIEGYAFKVITPRTRGAAAVDFLFSSLAEAMGARAIGIVLSGGTVGGLGDGTAGCEQIKAKGGTTFAQDSSAEVSGMPQSAQDAGCIDFVLSPKRIAARLKRLAKTSARRRGPRLKVRRST
jgi:two-component system CheB/CheR fusion protein